jgi:hypothetical protein
MNRVCSIFSQILQLLPRLPFEAKIQEHRERHARGFSKLDPDDSHAVLPTGTRAEFARDHWGAGGLRRQAAAFGRERTAQALDPGLRQ